MVGTERPNKQLVAFCSQMMPGTAGLSILTFEMKVVVAGLNIKNFVGSTEIRKRNSCPNKFMPSSPIHVSSHITPRAVPENRTRMS